ncbi:MAG TPA: hypothetical protein VEA36_03845 [Candidatus Paceibacterota bacterium]|nr:hypothetical protein [Candidatus Paceibacterota bacterium]
MKKFSFVLALALMFSPLAASAATFSVNPDPIYRNETFDVTCSGLGSSGNEMVTLVMFTPDQSMFMFTSSCDPIEQTMNESLLGYGTYTWSIYDDNSWGGDGSYSSFMEGPWVHETGSFEMIDAERP